MWSIGLVVGVAVAASMVLLVVGITLAIAFERRRYRRYIKHHTAGIGISLVKHVSRTAEDCNGDTEGRYSPQGAIQTTLEPCMTLSTSSTNQQEGVNELGTEIPKPPAAPMKNLHERLRDNIKKQSSDRQRLTKKAPLKLTSNSPLSTISERSERVRLFQGHEIVPPTVTPKHTTVNSIDCSHSCCLVPTSEPDGSAAQVQCDYNGVVNSHTKITPAVHVPKSDGTTTSALLASKESPTDSTTMISGKSHRSSTKSHTSTASLDSVNSSVLDSSILTHCWIDSPNKIVKSQALQDLDFGPRTMVNLSSPAHSIPPSKRNPRAETVRSFRASMSSELDPRCHNEASVDFSYGSIRAHKFTKQAETPITGFGSRHSMFDNVKALRKRSYVLTSGCLAYEYDPFIIESVSRPASIECRIPLKMSDGWSQMAPTSGSYFEARRWSKTTPIEVANSAFEVPALKFSKPLRLSSSQLKTSNRDCDGPRVTRSATVSKNSEIRYGSSGPRKVDCSDLKHCDSLRPNPEPLKQTISATPNSISSNPWNFDFVLANSPRPSSPLRSYDSPTLPSPVYNSTNLYSRPQRSKVIGPRSPPGQSSSPLNPNKRSYQRNDANMVSSLRINKRKGSTDLRKSIQQLRSMNSDYYLRDPMGDMECQKPISRGKSSYITGTEPADQKAGTMPQDGQVRLHSSTVTPLIITSNAGLKAEGEARISASQSSGSIGGFSIWEDASVCADSPECEVPPLPEAILSTMHISKAKGKDYVPDENFVNNYGGNVSPIPCMERKNLGLGLRFGRSTVPDTPGSMYDESGFLKE